MINDRDVRDGVIRTLTLNRLSSRNALDTHLIERLTSALRVASEDDHVRAVVLDANGPVFCAGGDLKEFRDKDNARDQMAARARRLALLLEFIPSCSVPVVAAVQGPAVGAGAALALSADMVVAGEDFTVSFPEFGNSVVPAVVLPILVRQTGQKLAFELLTQGRKITAKHALSAGLVNVIAGTIELHAEAQRIAETWAKTAPNIVAETKALLQRVDGVPLADGLEAGITVTAATWRPDS